VTILTFDDLLTAGGRAPFREAFAAKTRWHLPAARVAEAAALLPWRMIDRLIADGLVPADGVRVAVNGHDLPASMYGDDKNRLRADAIQGLATQGATLIVNNIGLPVPAIGDLAIEMERELGCRVGVNCYITFGTTSAFRPHHDAHDVLILQIHGVKRWRCFGAPVAFPVGGSRPVVEREPEWEALTTPGDLLYLPRGEIHAAVAQTLPSVHLTIGIVEPTGIDFLQWLATKAPGLEALRRDLGRTLVGEARAVRDRDFAQAIRDLLDRARIADFFADHDREQPLRPLAMLGAGQRDGARFLPDARLVSALRRRTDLATGQEGESELRFGKRRIRLSQLCRRALEAITSGHGVTVASLAAGLALDAQDPEFVTCLEQLAAKSLIAIHS
jgi:hypothetical protein